SGELRFHSAGTALGRVSVNVDWRDAPDDFSLTVGDPPSLTLHGGRSSASPWTVCLDYGRLGVEHIWGGLDHLLFVIGLLLLANNPRRLLLTISAFTLAHSITLATASLKLLRLPTGPVEICIALSVLLLAVEASRRESTFAQQKPWLVAFGF